MTDQGSGACYAETDADLQGTRVVLGELAPLINQRRGDLLPAAAAQMDALRAALRATRHDGVWTRASETSPAARRRIDAAIGALLETLAPVPDLLAIRDS
jgi:high-affinity iron transporter